MHPEGYYVYIPATIVLLIITFLGWRWYEKHTKHRESVTGCSEEVATVSDVAYSDAKTHSWWTMSTKPGECKDLEKQAGKTN